MKRSSPRAELPAATMRRRSRVTTRAIVFAACASLGCAPVYTQEPTTLDMDMAHCGKKFRIATHIAPPYIMVDVDKCVAQKCGPEAFGDNGGVVYKLMMEHILPQLRTYCKEKFKQETGYPEFVDFEWYLPGLASDFTSAEKAVEMVCQGQFHGSFLRPLAKSSPKCPSATQYQGPSPADGMAKALGLPLCSGAYVESGNAGCISSGPDLVVGAVHVTGRYLDMLDFTVPYMAVQQLLVKRKKDESIETLIQERMDQVFTIFQPFDLVAWMAILGEIVFVMFIFLTVEAAIFIWLCNCCLDFHINDQVAPGFHGIIDCWYWAFSMAFDPGASGKYPITTGGRIYLVAHAFFVTIILTSYTGTVGPAIMSADLGDVKSFDTLKSGAVSVAVVGPRWDPNADPVPYLGNYAGTSIPRPDIYVPESVQFKMLQSEMKVNSGASFSVVTGQNMMSTDKLGKPFLHTKGQDPCSEKSRNEGISLGIYDMVRCKSINGKKVPHATIHDAPQVVHEMMFRYNNTGECSLVAKGERFGSSSYGIGFPKNTSLTVIFSRAIERVKFKGQVDKLLREARLLDMYNKCSEAMDSGESLAVSLLSGLFMVVFSLIFIALLGSCIVRGLGLPFSTLSDTKIQRTKEKDAERDYIAANKVGKEVSNGRSARMKGHKMTGHEKHDRETPAERAKREREELLLKMGIDGTYNPTFVRKDDLVHKSTRLMLTQLHDFCERFQDEVLTIEKNARAAKVKAQDAMAETTSMGASSRMSRAGARSIRASVASASQPGTTILEDGITVSSKRNSSIFSSKTKRTGRTNGTDATSSVSVALNPELVFADFTASFPKKQDR